MDAKTLAEEKEKYIHSDEHEQLLIKRYADLQDLMTAVKLGNADAALAIITQVMDNIHKINQLYSPQAETFRVVHNQLVSMNTFCMICALSANPNPLYLHAVNRHYDTMIEKITNTTQAIELIPHMFRDYCSFSNYFDQKKYSDTIQQAIWNITADPARPLNLTALSKALGMSPSSLSRKFHQETGCTISQYQTRFRIRSAERYLLEGNLTITQVAQHVGFNDASYFSKVFTKETGCSPTEYIRQFRKL